MEPGTMQDTLADMRERFKDVRKMLDGHEKLSTESKRYEIIYRAIEIKETMESDLVNVLSKVPEEMKGKIIAMLAVVHLNLGLLNADTDEPKTAEEQFMKCINLLKNRELEPEAILSILNAHNQLGIIWFQWSEPAKAKTFLDIAERIYKDFTNTGKDPISMAQNFDIEDSTDDPSPKEVLEKVHTLTLFYLAQVYTALNNPTLSRICCHITLRRQLGQTTIAPDLNYIDWALNAATLSQCFIENNGISQARHHLAAAYYILQKYENILKEKTETNEASEVLAAEWEEFNNRSADIARCWARYGIFLLKSSQERLLLKSEEEEENEQLDTTDELKALTMDDLKFPILEKEIESIENQITDKYLLDFDDAKSVFLNAQKWLEQAKEYYCLKNHASDYVSITQDMSEAYFMLAFFEEHEDRQAKMHKRRIDILENVVNELNPQYYKSACRQIWIELAETYSILLDIKLDRLRSTDERPTPQARAKINRLAKSSIKYHQTFLDSLETGTPDSELKQFPEDMARQALFSYFHLGRLYRKIITSDKKIQAENEQKGINAYRFIVAYCEKYPKLAEQMVIELHLCKEFLRLRPIKPNDELIKV